jgi:hypothetical protein
VNLRWMIVLCVVCVTVVAWFGQGALAARNQHRDAVETYEETESALRELRALQSRQPDFIELGQEGEDLTRRVTRVLTSAGLGANALSSLTPEADQPASSARTTEGKPVYLRRSARISLDGVTMGQLGRFMEAWRTSTDGAGWTVSTIDLAAGAEQGGSRIKAQASAANAPVNRDQNLRVNLTMEVVTPTAASSHSNNPAVTPSNPSPTEPAPRG